DALEGSPVRLVCTYRGAGTEYGFGIQDVARSVPVSSVLMTRPCDTERQFWHRDPPVERVTDTRLQLTLDAVSEREAAPKTVH
ncbi:MAG: DUF1826 domain-containing protein, partial [Litoreibacter sp.]|nr:DUF1826 domain-containing protein [Litoreibacter sp.]